MLASPQILILDEATSNLDTESEQLIQASMAALLAGRTTFVIAHRLSTIRRADLILLLEDGRIVERGTHEELMSAGGMYYKMVRRQMEFSAGETAELELDPRRRLETVGLTEEMADKEKHTANEDNERTLVTASASAERSGSLFSLNNPLLGSLGDLLQLPHRPLQRPALLRMSAHRSPTSSIRSGMLRRVNDCGITFPLSTSSQVHGADTGAPRFGRSAYAAAKVAL